MYMYNQQLCQTHNVCGVNEHQKVSPSFAKAPLVLVEKVHEKALVGGRFSQRLQHLGFLRGGGGGGQQGCIRFQENFKESSTDILSYYYYVNLQLISPHCNKDSVHRLWLICHTCTYIIIFCGLLFTLAHTVTAWIKHMGIKFTTTKPLSHCLVSHAGHGEGIHVW